MRLRERLPQSCHGGQPPRRRAACQHALGEDREPDAVVVMNDNLGEAGGRVAVHAEPVERACTHFAGSYRTAPADVDEALAIDAHVRIWSAEALPELRAAG